MLSYGMPLNLNKKAYTYLQSKRLFKGKNIIYNRVDIIMCGTMCYDNWEFNAMVWNFML